DAAGSHFQSARIALGAVGPTPILAHEAGDSLHGKPISDEAIEHAARLAIDAAHPIADMRGTVAQRKHLVGVLVRRALAKAIQRAKDSQPQYNHTRDNQTRDNQTIDIQTRDTLIGQ